MIVNLQNGHKYLGSDVRPLNKVWREILEKYESLKLSNNRIYDRTVYKQAAAAGKGVSELKNIKAKQEIENLVEEITNARN